MNSSMDPRAGGDVGAEAMLAAFDAAPIGMALARLDGSIARVNPRLCELMGLPCDELLAGSYMSFSTAEELETELPMIRLLLAGELDSFEVPRRYVRPDGDVRHGTMRVTPVHSADGAVEYVLAIIEDVTLRVVAEHERRSAEEQLQAVMDLSPMGIILADAQRALLANRAEREITGQDMTSIADMREILHPDDVDAFEAIAADAFAAGRPWSARTRILHADGSIRWCRVTAGSGNVGSDRLVVITEDITEQIGHELELARFAELFAALTDFVAMADEQGRVQYLNRIGQMYGDRLGAEGAELAAFFDEPSQAVLRNTAWRDVCEHGFWTGEVALSPAAGLTIPVSLVLVRCQTALGDRFIAAVARDITELKEAHRRLEDQATHDQLTGLPNRRLLADRMQNALARADRSDDDVAVLFIDLDGFKAVNDTYGHDVGDDVLIAVGHRLRTLVREGDTVARLGGDEFVVLLDPVTAVDGAPASAMAVAVADRIVASLTKPVRVPRAAVQLGASIGVALASTCGGRANALLRAADVATYSAKRLGKSRAVLYDAASEAA